LAEANLFHEVRPPTIHGGQSVEVRVVFHGGTSALGQGLEQARVPPIGSATRAHPMSHGTLRWTLRGFRPRRLDLMRPFPSEPMRMWPISARINKPEIDDASIVEPIEPATSSTEGIRIVRLTAEGSRCEVAW
jgi:hypothetical protein